MDESSRKVRVFVSYSHDSRKHAAAVQLMAAEIEEEGFSVFLDQWAETPNNWAEKIEQEFWEADVVLCVCTPKYSDRVNGLVPAGTGRGAVQEGSMLRNEMFDLKQRADRFWAVHLEGSEVVVPRVMGGKGTNVFRWPTTREAIVRMLRAPKHRRRIIDAIEQACGDDIDTLDEWAHEFVPLGTDVVLDFEKRSRQVASEVLRLDDAGRKRDALASLADWVGDDERRSLDQLAKDLDLGTLVRGEAQARPRPRPTSPRKTEPRISEDELRRYLTKAKARHEEIQLIGFETTVRATMQLDDLYVPLDAMIDRGGRARDVYAGAQLAEDGKAGAAHLCRQDVPLAEAFSCARQMGTRGVIVLGDPGSGKTTHLKQVLLKVIADGPESIGLPEGTVPVFLPLRDLPKDRSGELPGFIQEQLRDRMLGTAPDFGKRLCERGRLLLLLDGLDEVANAEERAEVAEWINELRLDAPESYFLVSCRYAGYTKDVELDAAFLELHLRPLNDEQMTRFVTNWYAIVERAALADPQQAEIEAERRTKDLLETLSKTEFTAVARVYEMTRNPLLLTAICLVHRDRGRLPKARARLYEESIAVLLERWRRRIVDDGSLPVDQAARVLQPVAHWMHSEDGRTRASKEELREPVRQGLALLRGLEVDADHFLEVIRDDSGLLTGWGMDEYGFMHLGFQEYLTARWLRARGLKKPSELWGLAQRFGESWWQEVILLLLALDEPPVFEELMRAVVRQPEFSEWAESEAMALALGESAVLSAAPFVEALTSTEGAKAERAKRQLAAAELLARAMPGEFEGLRELLREHPTTEVRQWWWSRTNPQESNDASIVTSSGLELVLIPAGRFFMGSPEGEGERDNYTDGEKTLCGDTHPEHRHEVELNSFYLAKTPVTNAQYSKFLEANSGIEKPRHWGNRKWNQPEQPVVGVSWEEAQAYCEWAGLTLPTEAQWEYACRAETMTRYYAGSTEQDLARVGWYDKNSDGRTQPVGQKEPNAFGLHDMHGNVWEWCRDAFGSYSIEPRSGDGLRHESVGDVFRVVRGGGWGDRADCARSAARIRWPPGLRYDDVGFRPARAITSNFPSPWPESG